MLGEKLQMLRKQRNYSLRTLAKLTGLSHSFICDIEHGRCKPSIDNLCVLADALEIRPEIFFSIKVVDSDQKSEEAATTKVVNQ